MHANVVHASLVRSMFIINNHLNFADNFVVFALKIKKHYVILLRSWRWMWWTGRSIKAVYYIHILDLSVTYLDKLFLLHNC